MEVLKDCKVISKFQLFAYCLMGNHVHLLLKIQKEKLEQIFKRIGARFVYWYNWKYERSGHLFQDRFRSEPIDDDGYLLTVVRYIHMNPVKAGICKNVSSYKFSSYTEYVSPHNGQLTDIDFVIGLLPQNEFAEFHNKNAEDKCLELDERVKRLTDTQLLKEMVKISKCKNATEFQQLAAVERDLYLKKIKAERVFN